MPDLPHAPPSWLTRAITFLFRPRLEIIIEPEACVDLAGVIYADKPDEAYAGLFLRGWVSNFGIGETAYGCLIHLEELYFHSKPFDSERSPLAWTHKRGDARFAPRSVPTRKRRALQFDICKVDDRNNEFQILTEKSDAGYTASSNLVNFALFSLQKQQPQLLPGK